MTTIPTPGHEPSLRDLYRTTFINQFGIKVMGDILAMCHFGETLDASNPQQIGEYNIGIGILVKLGIIAPNTRKDVIEAICSVLPREDER